MGTASQLYPFSMCQEMPTGLYTRWVLDKNSQKIEARTKKYRKLENMVMFYLQLQRPECTIESYYTTGKQKMIHCFSMDRFCSHRDTVFKAMGCYFHFCPCQESRTSLSEEEMQRGIRKRGHDKLRSKGYNIVEVWECKWWERVEEEEIVRNNVRKNLPFNLPKKQESLCAKIRGGNMFVYVQCDLEVPNGLKYN